MGKDDKRWQRLMTDLVNDKGEQSETKAVKRLTEFLTDYSGPMDLFYDPLYALFQTTRFDRVKDLILGFWLSPRCPRNIPLEYGTVFLLWADIENICRKLSCRCCACSHPPSRLWCLCPGRRDVLH